MASRIGALYVDLALNTKQFIDELDKSRTRSATFGVAVGTIFANVAQSAARMAKDAALAFPRLIEAQIDLADETNKAAQRTGVAVEALSALRHAAELSDVSFGQLETGLGRLARNMSDTAHGTGEARKAFRELGISVTGTEGELRPIQEVLGDVAERFAGLQDGAQKTALTLQIFGRGSQTLIPLLNQGRAGLEEMTKEAERLGLVMSAETALAAEEFNDNMKRLHSTLGGVGLQVAAQVLPAFVNLTNAFVSAATEGDRVKTVGEAIGGGLRSATQFALGSALAVTGFVGALSLLAEEIQRVRLEAAKGFNAVVPKFLEGDVSGLQKGLDERQKRTLAIADATQTILDLMNAVDEAATKAGKAIGGTGTIDIDPDADKKKKELESLIAAFEKSLAPASALNENIVKLMASGKSAADVMRVYGEEITKAVSAQRAFGQPIPEEIAQLAEQIEIRRQTINQIREQVEATFRLSAGPAIMESLRVAAAQLPLTFREATVSLEGLTAAFDALESIAPIDNAAADSIAELDAAFERLGLKSSFALSGISAQASKDFIAVSTSGKASAQQIAAAFVVAQEAIRESARAGVGFWGEEQQKALQSAQAELDKFAQQDKLKDGFREVGVALTSGLEAALRKWEGFGKALEGILNDIQATIIRTFVTTPLSSGLAGLIQSIGGAVIGGIGGGLGSAAGSAANLPTMGTFAFAEGGEPPVGKDSIVGERGPELFVPASTPAANLGATNSLSDSVTPDSKPSLGRSIFSKIAGFYKASFAKPFAFNVASGIASKGFGGVSGHFLSNTPGLFGFLSSLFLKKGSRGTLEQLPKITPFLNSAFGGQGAKLPDFKTLLSPDNETSITAPPQLSSMPMLLGTRGPEIFKPPEPGTIVPLNTPENMKIYQYFKSMGRTREHGGDVGYMTGERGREMFLPASLGAGGTGGGNTTNIYLTVNGDPDQSVIRKMQQALKEVYQASVRDSQRGMIEHKLRTV